MLGGGDGATYGSFGQGGMGSFSIKPSNPMGNVNIY